MSMAERGVDPEQPDPIIPRLFAEHGYTVEGLEAVMAYVHGRERTPDIALIAAPIEDFAGKRQLLLEFIQIDVMEHETYRWSQAEDVLGIPWPTQIRLLLQHNHHSPLYGWDEYDQDLFEQDVRSGMGRDRLAKTHRLPVSQARTLLGALTSRASPA